MLCHCVLQILPAEGKTPPIPSCFHPRSSTCLAMPPLHGPSTAAPASLNNLILLLLYPQEPHTPPLLSNSVGHSLLSYQSLDQLKHALQPLRPTLLECQVTITGDLLTPCLSRALRLHPHHCRGRLAMMLRSIPATPQTVTSSLLPSTTGDQMRGHCPLRG